MERRLAFVVLGIHVQTPAALHDGIAAAWTCSVRSCSIQPNCCMAGMKGVGKTLRNSRFHASFASSKMQSSGVKILQLQSLCNRMYVKKHAPGPNALFCHFRKQCPCGLLWLVDAFEVFTLTHHRTQLLAM